MSEQRKMKPREIIKNPVFAATLSIIKRGNGRPWAGFNIFSPLPLDVLDTDIPENDKALVQTKNMGRSLMNKTIKVTFQNVTDFVGDGDFKMTYYGVKQKEDLNIAYEIDQEQLKEMVIQSRLVIEDPNIV